MTQQSPRLKSCLASGVECVIGVQGYHHNLNHLTGAKELTECYYSCLLTLFMIQHKKEWRRKTSLSQC